MNKFNMFITAVCVLFLIKLRWPKNKSINAQWAVFNDAIGTPWRVDEISPPPCKSASTSQLLGNSARGDHGKMLSDFPKAPVIWAKSCLAGVVP